MSTDCAMALVAVVGSAGMSTLDMSDDPFRSPTSFFLFVPHWRRCSWMGVVFRLVSARLLLRLDPVFLTVSVSSI